MGAACVGRVPDVDCCGRPRRPGDEDEQQEELRVAAERERLLSFVDEEDEGMRSKILRFYSVKEIGDLEEFRSSYCGQSPQRRHTLLATGFGPHGVSTARGGDRNSWHDIDASAYVVRGPTYLSDRKKEASAAALAELIVVDLFMSDTDVPRVAMCEAAKTVHRLRRAGEGRMLLVLNFRLVPLHVVAVWALPPGGGAAGPAGALLARFAGSGMADAERSSRLKVIPRIIQGPWPIRRLVGENSPAILGRGIPVKYFASERELEVSVAIASSAAAQRVSKALVRAGSALDIELALLIEGQAASELPEQLLGGFRLCYTDISSLRKVEPRAAPREAPQLERPSFLPSP